MITKIFYSLVLFNANIKYNKKNNYWFYLDYIEENKFWELKIIFKKDNLYEEIFFKHIDFLNEKIDKNKLKTKNWIIYWNNKQLLEDVYSTIIKSDIYDFNFYKDKTFYNKIPFWVVLTITSKCNIFCYYCFNDIDYDLKYRNIRRNKWLDYWKKVVDKLYKAWTRVIILTWWEPMVAPFFWKLLDYLKEKNIFVHLNTNWTLLTDDNLEKLNNNYALNIMVSMHEFNDKDYYNVNRKWLEMTFWINKVPDRFKHMFTDKIKQLRKIKNYKNIFLEFLTILVWKNVLNLEKIYEFWLNNSWIEFHNWQFFRLYATKNNKWASKQLMELAINKIYLLNKKYWVNYKIVDPVPFCVTKNIDRASKVIDWVLSDAHNVKTIITTDGYVQLMSAYDNNFWNISDISIEKIFNSNFVKKMLNNWFLPRECNNCKYKNDCKWGSRMDANIINWSYDAWDPIGDINNKVVY